MKRKTYFLASASDFQSGKLTGAQKRLMEFVKRIAVSSNVILLSYPIPEIEKIKNIQYYELEPKTDILPDHIAGMHAVVKVMRKRLKRLIFDYAISFHPIISISYHICGYHNIISLFRENLIGYRLAAGAFPLKIQYFRFLEHQAVRVSDKIIVQCKDDKRALIERNRKFCPDIAGKTFIQINNVNASWMHAECAECRQPDNHSIRILFIGNFSDRRKGHGILLPAVRRLIDEGYQIRLFAAGDGKQLAACRDKYRAYPQIVFPGRVDVQTWLGNCDFEIVPSLIDSCPNTVLEAIQAGVTVYGSRTGGIPDLLKEEKYMFFPDSKSIYRFLKDKIKNRSYIQEREEQKKIKEVLTFDWTAKIQEIIEHEM